MEQRRENGYSQSGAMRSPKRLYHAGHMAGGVHLVAEQAIKEAPQRLAAHLAPPTAEEQPEILEAHCLGCKTKRQFQVEGEDKMKNGATRKYGKCSGDGCGRTISTFVKGAQDAAA